LLIGDLGAGKTTFVKGLARGLNIDPDEVLSPTFVLLREYKGEVSLYHADAYRTESPSELVEIGGTDYFNSDGIFVIEWGDRWESLAPADSMRIEIELLGGDQRKIRIESVFPLDL
jgi:tRNA threonylcarbamoyladenosine biosynthesis protein TsaE